MKHKRRPPVAISRRAIVAVLAWAGPAFCRSPAFAMPDIAPQGMSLTGQLLIAAPSISDPRFVHTVMLMVRHSKDGAMGVTINRPIGTTSLARLINAIGGDAAGVDAKIQVFAGGPVAPDVCFILHDPAYRHVGTIDIDGQVAMTPAPDVLRDIGHHIGPRRYLVAFGYAGWGPGQLEGELARRDWDTAPDDPALVFDADRAKVWDLAAARAGRTL